MILSEDFWLAQQGLLLVSDSGALRFTQRGRAQYAPLFATYRFSISTVSTVDRFREVMAHVSAAQLADNERRMRMVLSDPSTTEEERALIRRVLGI